MLASFVLVIVVSVIAEFFIKWAEQEGLYTDPVRTVASFMDWLATITGAWGFAFAFGLVAGGTLFMWIEYTLRVIESRKIKDPYKYVPTKLRLKHVEGGVADFVEDESQNIFSWQQTYADIEFKKSDGSIETFGVNHIFIVFAETTGYLSPQINSFGHSFPRHTWCGHTDRSIILQVQNGDLPPIFEINFPRIPKG